MTSSPDPLFSLDGFIPVDVSNILFGLIGLYGRKALRVCSKALHARVSRYQLQKSCLFVDLRYFSPTQILAYSSPASPRSLGFLHTGDVSFRAFFSLSSLESLFIELNIGKKQIQALACLPRFTRLSINCGHGMHCGVH